MTWTLTKKNHKLLDGHTKITPHHFERFLSKVEPGSVDDCWNWTGCLDAHGYGAYSIGRKLFKAHRASYLLHYGRLDNNLSVCHSCDNPACVNPYHLWEGTHKDNMNDRGRKGRTRTGHLYGEDNPRSKLTKRDVSWIRKNYNPDVWSTRKLARKFGVSQTLIRNILDRKAWKTT